MRILLNHLIFDINFSMVNVDCIVFEEFLKHCVLVR